MNSQDLQAIALVFLGGGWGSVSRYWVGRWLNPSPGTGFPWGTWAVNVGGCLLIGWVLALSDRHHLDRPQTLLLATGFCGGFTTFSTFIYELQALGNPPSLGAWLYGFTSLGVGLGAVQLGLWLGRTGS